MKKVTGQQIEKMFKKFYLLHKQECKKQNNRYLRTKYVKTLERIINISFSKFNVLSWTSFYIVDFRMTPKINFK